MITEGEGQASFVGSMLLETSLPFVEEGEFASKSRLEIIFIALTDTIKSHEFYFNNCLNLKIDLKRKTDK